MNLEWGTITQKLSVVNTHPENRSLNIHSIHGPVRNPFNFSPEKLADQERSAGGSSGGSAAAVAAGMCDA